MSKEQEALYEFLVEYVTDEETAKIIIDGGEQGFYYGIGGYTTIDANEVDSYVNEGYNVIDDASLTNTYLIGSQP